MWNLSESKKRQVIMLLWLIGSLLYISLIFNNNLWMDEAFSAALIRGSFSEVLERSAADTLPPLYNILNFTITSILGYHPWVMKLLSVIPLILCMGMGATFIFKRFGFEAAALYICCLWGMPWLPYYGVEIRMYALGLFFVTGAGIAALEVALGEFQGAKECCEIQDSQAASETDKKENRLSARINVKPWIFLLIMTVGAGYTHHFAFVSAGMVYLLLFMYFALDYKNKKRQLIAFLINLIATGILYLPCLLVTVKQAKRVTGYFSMPDMNFKQIVQCLKLPFITGCTPLSLVLIALFGAAICEMLLEDYEIIRKNKLSARKAIKDDSAETAESKNCRVGAVVFCVYPLTLAFGVFATRVLHSNIFAERYLVPSFGLLWLAFSIAMSGLIERVRLMTGAKKNSGAGDGENVAAGGKGNMLAGYAEIIIFAIVILCSLQGYRQQFLSEYAPGVSQMINYFENNISAEDEYIIFEDDYQIEICFRYYFPEFKSTTVEQADECRGQLYYIKVPGFEEKEDELLNQGYTLDKVGDFSFDRYSFELYRAW